MDDNDKALDIVRNQRLMPDDEWQAYAQPIREKVAAIIEEYGDAPKEQVFTRIGSGGKFFDYVRDGFFEEILNKHFPDWSFMLPHPPSSIGQLVYVSGRLILNFNGVRRIFDDTGEDKMRTQDDGSMVPGAVKSATTDCFKRCCHRALGAAQNVYNKKDLERASNVQRVKNVIDYLEEALADPESISSEDYRRLESALEYFEESEANLPTTDKGWTELNQKIKSLANLKETVDAKRTRRD